MNNKSRLSYILTVFAGLCLVGCGGCKQKQAEDVPAMNQEQPAADEAAKAAAAAKAADEAKAAEEAKAKAAADEAAAKAAKEKADADAKVAADAKAAEDAAAKAAADAKAAEEAAKAAHEKQEAEAMAAAKAAAEAQAKADAEAQAAAEKHAAEEAAAKAAAEAEAKAAAEAAAKKAPDASSTKVGVSEVPALAKSMATAFASTEIPNIFGSDHGRIVVQVNRTSNTTDLAVDRAQVYKAISSAFEGVSDVITTDNVNGRHNVKQPKAIHLAFEPECKALRIIPSRSVQNAPAVIVNSAVTQDDKGAVLTLKAVDSSNGKVIWTESKPLSGEAVVQVATAEGKCESCGECEHEGKGEDKPAPAAPEADAKPAEAPAPAAKA